MYLVESIVYYCHCDSKCVRAMSAENIRYWDLTFVQKGSMTYRCNGTEVTLQAGDAILLPEGSLRERICTGGGADFVSINFHFYPHTEPDLPWYLPGAITPDLQRLAAAYPQPFLLPADYSRERLACLTNFILFELMNRQKRRSGNPHVSLMLQMIRDHITESLTLSELAAAAHITKEYAAQIFKKETGSTVTDYIHEQKMQMASEMIRKNDMALPEIAESLGFSNYSYFSRLFKRYFGVSPSRMEITQ